MRNVKKNNWFAYLYILPTLFFVGVFLVFPILFNVASSFTKWKGLSFEKAKFIGFKNYSFLLHDAIFLKALSNCLLFMVLTIFFQLSLGLLLTVLLDRKLPGYKIFETVYFLPVVLSSVIIGYTFSQIFEPNFGTLNTFLDAIGLGNLKHIWIGDPKLALYTVLIANIYQWTGMGIIYYRAGMANISSEIYESAKIDGAGFWQTFLRITVPLLNNIHLILILLGTIGTLKFFDLVYIMTKGGPAGSSEFPLSYLYKRFIGESNSGLASAVAVLIILIATILSALEIKLSKKFET
jgi:raffinose/stachyose/melibiose transport system permease protein